MTFYFVFNKSLPINDRMCNLQYERKNTDHKKTTVERSIDYLLFQLLTFVTLPCNW